MKLTKLVPNIFYADMNTGKKVFVDCLGFSILYEDMESEQPLCIVARDAIKICLIQSEEFASKDRPEIRIETDDIEAVYNLVKEKNPGLLHPNANKIKASWGPKEFALRDESDVCIVFQQFA